MTMIKKFKKNKGFTLVEVLAGMLILSVGLLLLLPMMVVSMQGNDFARGFTEASMLIKEKMEELKNMSLPVSGTDTVNTVYRSWTVSDASAKLKRLVVQVSWTDRDGRMHNNSMVSYMMVN
jgi:prepilin-type N-terminal cleavage/methylation domain-containing protein